MFSGTWLVLEKGLDCDKECVIHTYVSAYIQTHIPQILKFPRIRVGCEITTYKIY
jgi:hypothetical protein